MIAIIVSALTLVVTIISAAWLNHSATTRANQQLLEAMKLSNQQLLEVMKLSNQQLLEGMKFSNQQLLEGIKLTIGQVDKRIDEVGKRLDRGVEVGDIGRVVLGVVQFHGPRVDVRLEGGERIRQRRQEVLHGRASSRARGGGPSTCIGRATSSARAQFPPREGGVDLP